jgi:hypothetical protein
MPSEAVSKAKRGLNVLGLAVAGMTKRPPCRPGPPLDTSGLGGKGWGALVPGGALLPQPANASAVPSSVMRQKEGAVMMLCWL